MLLSMRYFPALLFLEYGAGLPAGAVEFFWTSIYSKPEEGKRHVLAKLKGGSAISLTYNGQFFSLFGWEKGLRFPDAEYQEPVFSQILTKETRQIPVPNQSISFKCTLTPELYGERKNLSPYLKDAFIRIQGLFSEYIAEKNIFDPIMTVHDGSVESLIAPWDRLMYGAAWRNKQGSIGRFASELQVVDDNGLTLSVQECIRTLLGAR